MKKARPVRTSPERSCAAAIEVAVYSRFQVGEMSRAMQSSPSPGPHRKEEGCDNAIQTIPVTAALRERLAAVNLSARGLVCPETE